MDQLVEATPKEFRFLLNPLITSKLDFQLRSKSDTAVVFKIRVTVPERYSVQPPAGVILPGQTVDVLITMQAYGQIPPDIFSCKDKFRLEAAPQPEIGSSDITELWAKVEKKSMAEETYRVKMEIGDGNLWRKIAIAKDQEATQTKIVPGPLVSSGMGGSELKALELQSALAAKEKELLELRRSCDTLREMTEKKAAMRQAESDRFLGVPTVQIALMFFISLLTIKDDGKIVARS